MPKSSILSRCTTCGCSGPLFRLRAAIPRADEVYCKPHIPRRQWSCWIPLLPGQVVLAGVPIATTIERADDARERRASYTDGVEVGRTLGLREGLKLCSTVVLARARAPGAITRDEIIKLSSALLRLDDGALGASFRRIIREQ